MDEGWLKLPLSIAPNGKATLMARETITRLVDDIDGGPAHETLRVGLDGQMVEVDLSTKNAKALRDAVGPYIEHGTRIKATPVSGGPRRGGAQTIASSHARNSAIREWAQASGLEVAERGRIRQDIVDAYDRAGGRVAAPVVEEAPAKPAKKTTKKAAPAALFAA